MKSQIIYLPVIMALIMVVSCNSVSNSEKPNNSKGTTSSGNSVFDPSKISQDMYVSTRDDVRNFIDELNKIISKGDYNSWKAALSQEYFSKLSSPENLNLMSEQPAMKRLKIVLKTAEDYFKHVVVPSRANSRVDDIEFIGENRVKAFTINTNRAGEEQRLRLYDLEKTNNTWKIIN
jgi:hypothetical protein